MRNLKQKELHRLTEERKAEDKTRKGTEDHKNQRLAILKRLYRVMKMSWRENKDWRQLPDGSGDGRSKKNKSGEDGSYRTAQVSHGDGRRKKSKTEEDGSYHSAEVSP